MQQGYKLLHCNPNLEFKWAPM